LLFTSTILHPQTNLELCISILIDNVYFLEFKFNKMHIRIKKLLNTKLKNETVDKNITSTAEK